MIRNPSPLARIGDAVPIDVGDCREGGRVDTDRARAWVFRSEHVAVTSARRGGHGAD